MSENQFTQKMQIAIKSKTLKIISGIVATICLIALAWFFLSPFWFWVSLEIIAALLVAIGCSGEWWLHHHPAGRRKKEKDEHHKLESRFITMVSLGVIMEIVTLGHSIREGVNLENEVSEAKEHVAMLESTNLVLKFKLIELGNRQFDSWMESHKLRIFRPEQFADSLKGKPKLDVEILYPPDDENGMILASEMQGGFEIAEWRVIDLRPFREDDDLLPKGSKTIPPWLNIPLSMRVGGQNGMIALLLKEGTFNSLMNTNSPLGAVAAAIDSIPAYCVMPTPRDDPRLPTNVLKVIIGPRF